MEEELNENELEERFYSMLHHVDETQSNVKPSSEASPQVQALPRSNIRRYWRTSGDQQPLSTPYSKINMPKDAPNKHHANATTDNAKPKEEKKKEPEPLPAQLALFQSLVPQEVKNSIEIIEHEDTTVVELESSDEDEVVEVALPPKPTIMIESSDDEIATTNKQRNELDAKPIPQEKQIRNDREVSASPVPSAVSSLSDEYIRSDCIAFNISSHHPDNHSFDFSLHGTDLLDQSTPSKKRKKKKNKETSTPILTDSTPNKNKSPTNTEVCFATPKSKAKNKKQKTISYTVSEKSVPNADIYDSDSNQSITFNQKKSDAEIDKSSPNIDELNSKLPEIGKSKQKGEIENNLNSSDNAAGKKPNQTTKNIKRNSVSLDTNVIDLTGKSDLYNNSIEESIVMGNVTGFTECDDYDDPRIDMKNAKGEIKLGSTRVPAILYENLDFDNLKGKEKVCRNRRYSLTTLREEMEKFYNESWGGEDFNHREIQKYMSRDKSLWAIDPKDRMPSLNRKKPTCNYCNRSGHRDDMCRLKPAVCYMCGVTGHNEPRCPAKICVNCGSPSELYTTVCRYCCSWNRLQCAECGQMGHPPSHCPDLWRRYHNTIDTNTPLEENRLTKKHSQLFCSGCARRGHLVHTCRLALPFSGLPINTPFVSIYAPVYPPTTERPRPYKNPDSSIANSYNQKESNKRQSKSPGNDAAKRRYVYNADAERNSKSPGRKVSVSKDDSETDKVQEPPTVSVQESAPEKAPDFIPIGTAPTTNRDKKGQMIQDNEVSDTSDVVTSARIYITNELIEKLKAVEGQAWIKKAIETHNITLQGTEITTFLTIKGKLLDQEAFQSALREWHGTFISNKSESEAEINQEKENDLKAFREQIPKNKNNLLRKLTKSFSSLKEDLGEPNALYKEVTYLQNKHQQLLKQKVINPKQLSDNRDHINRMTRKLNMILLGQAGLADGPEHLSGLYALQEKLITHRDKNISKEMRNQVGQHYNSIFTASPRPDYCELIESFYSAKSQSVLKKRKKRLRVSPKKKKPIAVPSQPSDEPTIFPKSPKVGPRPRMSAPLSASAVMGKLKFFKQRLAHSRPADAVLKKTRLELTRKLEQHISALGAVAAGGGKAPSSKLRKKVKKLQYRAQTFLNSV